MASNNGKTSDDASKYKGFAPIPEEDAGTKTDSFHNDNDMKEVSYT